MEIPIYKFSLLFKITCVLIKNINNNKNLIRKHLMTKNQHEVRSRTQPSSSNKGRQEPTTTKFKDENVDTEVRYEFGGPIGVTLMMMGFPLLMYYLWLCVHIESGSFLSMKSLGDIQNFFNLIEKHASP